jgi:hypothetical protein
MTGQRHTRLALVLLVVGLASVLVSGCAQKASAPAVTASPATAPAATAGSTALANLAPAQSSLSTMAPDAKLLVVRLAEDVPPTGTPVWTFLFGSPSTDKSYVVYISQGQLMVAQEYGAAGLTKSEWSKVSGTEAWKVDSDAAYEKALAVSGLSGSPATYMMGLDAYKFSATSTVEPFVWRVLLAPQASGETTIHVNVNATTGQASVAR